MRFGITELMNSTFSLASFLKASAKICRGNRKAIRVGKFYKSNQNEKGN